jgi:hypothetical protein
MRMIASDHGGDGQHEPSPCRGKSTVVGDQVDALADRDRRADRFIELLARTLGLLSPACRGLHSSPPKPT